MRIRYLLPYHLHLSCHDSRNLFDHCSIVVEFGTTGVVAVLCHNVLTVGSVGDSRCYIVKESGHNALNIEHLSVVHNTENPDECMCFLPSCIKPRR